jgi:hypothetical protein
MGYNASCISPLAYSGLPYEHGHYVVATGCLVRLWGLAIITMLVHVASHVHILLAY